MLLKPTGTTPLNQQADFALTLASRVPPESPQENVARIPGQGGQGGQGGGGRKRARCGAITPAAPKVWPCWPSSRARRMQGLTPALPEQPCLRWPTTRISLPTQSPSPARRERPIPSPGWIWNNFARTQKWIRLLAARVALEAEVLAVADPEAVDPVAAVAVVLAEVEAVLVAAAGAVEAAEVAAAGEVGPRFRRRRIRQFPQLQAQSAPRRFLLDRWKQRAERRSFRHQSGKRAAQPSYAQNQFGLTFMGQPYIPHVIEHDTKDVIFFNADRAALFFSIQPIRQRALGCRARGKFVWPHHPGRCPDYDL